MARAKRESKVLARLQTRVAGMQQIDPNLDLGNGITVNAAQQLLNELNTDINEYNGQLADLDRRLNGIIAKEAEARDLSARILLATSVRYGRNSAECEMVGGTPLSERKKPAPKTKP